MQVPAFDADRVRTVVKPERLTSAAALEAGETGTHLGVLPVVSRTAQVPDGVLRHHLEQRPAPRRYPALHRVPPGTQRPLGTPLPLIQTSLEVGERPVVGVSGIPRMMGKSHPVTGIDVKRNAMRTNHVFQANSSARLRHFTMFTCRPPKRATTVCIRSLCGRLRQIINHCGYPRHILSRRHLLLDRDQPFGAARGRRVVPSEQAHEAKLAEDALVVVELGVAGAGLAHQGDLRAEPPDGEAAVEGVHPE